MYADDFKLFFSLLPQGLAGGVYMLLLSPSPTWRNYRSAARLIFLVPGHVNSNEVLLAIINDIVTMTVEAVTKLDSNGERVILFLDVVDFVAEYFEA